MVRGVFRSSERQARIFAFVLLFLLSPASAQMISWKNLHIISSDGTYLGNCNPDKFDSKSIFNEYGDHGSKYSSKSILNKYGDYGDSYSDRSAFSRHANDPPWLVYEGAQVCQLTVNKSIQDGVTPAELLSMVASYPNGYFPRGRVYSSSADSSPQTSASRASSAESRIVNLGIRASKTRLTEADLRGFSAKHLTLARNTIYARYGRSFTDPDLRAFFSRQSWYRVNPNYRDSLLSNLEETNAKFIMNFQKRRGLEW